MGIGDWEAMFNRYHSIWPLLVSVVGWIVAPQKYSHPEPPNVTLFEIKVFIDIIKVTLNLTSS